jgi:hypothetical protein
VLRAWASAQISEVLANTLVGSVGVITEDGLLDVDGDRWSLHPASDPVSPEDVVVVVRAVGSAVVVDRIPDWAAWSKDGSHTDQQRSSLSSGSSSRGWRSARPARPDLE